MYAFSDEQRASKDFACTRDRDHGLTSDEELGSWVEKDAQIGQLMQKCQNTSGRCTERPRQER
jgi:hypothetical protein